MDDKRYWLTANRLRDGAVVYLMRDGGWSLSSTNAQEFSEANARLAVSAQSDPGIVAACEVEIVGQTPLRLRDQIRCSGPTISHPSAVSSTEPEPARPHAHTPPHAGIYHYDEIDRDFVRGRVAQFRSQVARRLKGELTEDEFKTLRLMNGVYLQLHAYMLRGAIPYGVMTSSQLRCLARVARVYDKGYAHFTTRQNVQFNWVSLEQAPDALAEFAEVDMHAIQTSGNCVRNVTTDEFAGAARDEVADPRIYAEILRQWSLDHPEFSFLPRKFKIAVSASAKDRVAMRVHDIGLLAKRRPDGTIGLEVWVGGGLGRTPLIGKRVRDWLPEEDLIAYMEAILRVYNAYGRRDNIYKARIKVLVQQIGAEAFARQVEEEFALLPREEFRLDRSIVEAIRSRFPEPAFENLADEADLLANLGAAVPDFARWHRTNTHPHRMTGYSSVLISLKLPGGIPGDITAEQMEFVANLADKYAFGEIRVTHEQNLVLPHVRQFDLLPLWRTFNDAGLSTANINLIGNVISCPGMDYCSLASCRSIPVAQELTQHFSDPDFQEKIGEFSLNISGCINACAHHHVANLGLLGVDKQGEEFYQITLGGAAGDTTAIGQILGPAVPADQVVRTVRAIIDGYLDLRNSGELFIDTFRRLGIAAFRESIHAA